MIDINSAEEALTDKTVAIMPTQLNGRTCDMDEIINLQPKIIFQYMRICTALGSKFKISMQEHLHSFSYKFVSCQNIRLSWRWWSYSY